MSSDNDTRPLDRKLTFAGPGLKYLVRCAKCGKDVKPLGCRWEWFRGVKQRLGVCCATKPAKEKAKKQ